MCVLPCYNLLTNLFSCVLYSCCRFSWYPFTCRFFSRLSMCQLSLSVCRQSSACKSVLTKWICAQTLSLTYARFTLADPMPRLASNVVGGKSGRNHPMSRWDPIHIGRMERNAYIRVGWYQGVVQYCTTPYLVR